MYVYGGTLDLVGCKFLENSATYGDDIRTYGGTINIDGCPAGSSGAAGAALDIDTHFFYSGTITGERNSYSCGACVR